MIVLQENHDIIRLDARSLVLYFIDKSARVCTSVIVVSFVLAFPQIHALPLY